MSNRITDVINSTKGFLHKHSPEILTGIGVTSMITSTVLAVKATPKALILLEEAKTSKGEDLTRVEAVKTAWKPYIPAIITGVAGLSCIIGASAVNAKRNAVLATAYAISEQTLLTYRDKVIETLGEKKEKEIKEKIAQDSIDKQPVSSSQVIITGKGNTLCKEYLTGRYFRSDLDHIKKTINELNREMTYQNYVSLSDFYNKLGSLERTKTSDYMGWKLDDGLIELDFFPCLAENDEPCVVMDYRIAPKYDFDKFC